MPAAKKERAKRRCWTESEDHVLRKRYQDELTEIIANDLQRNISSVYRRASILGLKKSEAFQKSSVSGRMKPGDVRGKSGQFRPGNVPANKGKKGWQAGGRSVETQFKRGDKPHTWTPIGTEIVDSKDGYLKRKVQEHGRQVDRWRPVHVLLWIENNGPIPEKHMVRFKDGDKTNIAIENLECISFAENMRRNTLHRYPKPLVDTIRAKGVLTRQINKAKKENEKQDRRSA
ncbi:MAG: HNH endonuclease signature motif containing protein [Pseudomonadota bacterium]